MTVGELMTPFLKLSNNMHAETLVKAMGAVAEADGSWSAGLASSPTTRGRIGVDTSRIRLSDGSGLSRKVNVTADGDHRRTDRAQKEPWWPAWYDALPIAGNPERFVGGTLRNRMLNTGREQLHGKTGSLTGGGAVRAT